MELLAKTRVSEARETSVKKDCKTLGAGSHFVKRALFVSLSDPIQLYNHLIMLSLKDH